MGDRKAQNSVPRNVERSGEWKHQLPGREIPTDYRNSKTKKNKINIHTEIYLVKGKIKHIFYLLQFVMAVLDGIPFCSEVCSSGY